LGAAWRVQQSLNQVMRLSLLGDANPEHEPEVFQRKLARTVHTRRIDTLQKKVKDIRHKARAIFKKILKDSDGLHAV
jgi:glutamate-ammonia-ligase adenylyltransferase